MDGGGRKLHAEGEGRLRRERQRLGLEMREILLAE